MVDTEVGNYQMGRLSFTKLLNKWFDSLRSKKYCHDCGLAFVCLAINDAL